MLVASYLLGYNDDGSVNHVAVDQAFPQDMTGVSFLLSDGSSGEPGSNRDLLVFFPRADAPLDVLCLPFLPEPVVALLCAAKPLPLVDFSCGRCLQVCVDATTVPRCA